MTLGWAEPVSVMSEVFAGSLEHDDGPANDPTDKDQESPQPEQISIRCSRARFCRRAGVLSGSDRDVANDSGHWL